MEGVLLPSGLSSIPFVRDSVTLLPPIAWLWAVAISFAAWNSLDAWDDWMHGFRPRGMFLSALGRCGVSAIVVGYGISVQTLDGFTWSFLWKCVGVLQLTALLLSLSPVSNSLGRNSWGIFSLFVLWTPACIPVCAFAMKAIAISQLETLIASSTLAIGAMCTAGIATAMGAKLRWKQH